MRNFAAAAILIALAATPSLGQSRQAERRQAELDGLIANRTAGAPTSCIFRRTNQHVSAFGDNTLIFGDYGRIIYRNDPPGGCNGAGRDGIIITRSTIGQLCRGDIVDIVDRTSRFPIGTCTLGDFTPLRKAGKPARHP